MKRVYYFIITLSILFLGISCTSDEPFNPVFEDLPEATRTGANTFGCLLNGEVWLPYLDEKNKKSLSVKLHSQSIFMFSVNLKSDKIQRDEGIKIFIDCKDTDTYNLTGFTFLNNYNKLGCHIFSGNEKDIIFDITRLDFDNQIISGTFEAPNIPASCGSEPRISLTNGRFDVRFEK